MGHPHYSGWLLLLVLVCLLGKLSAPNLFSRLQALGTDLFLQGAFGGGDPRNSELCLILVVLNFDSVSNLQVASATAQPHTLSADIESMRKMDILTACDPESDRHDRFGSLRMPFGCSRSRHFHAHSE
jgi:hypothetical protein